MTRFSRFAPVAVFFGLALAWNPSAYADSLTIQALSLAQASLSGVADTATRSQAESLIRDARGALNDGDRQRAHELSQQAQRLLQR